MYLDFQGNCAEHTILCAVLFGMSVCKCCLETEPIGSSCPRYVLLCFLHPLSCLLARYQDYLDMQSADSDSPGEIRGNNWFGSALQPAYKTHV